MMQIILKYKNSKELNKAFKKNNHYEVVALTDKNYRRCAIESGEDVLSTAEAVGKYREMGGLKFAVTEDVRYSTLISIVEELCNWGVSRKDIFVVCNDFLTTPLDEYIVNIDDYVRIPYLEFHAADYCNLNCKGCVHFSPLVKERVFPDVYKIEKDLMQLKKKIKFIDTIRILGGEPLLNPDLKSFVSMTRKVYPYSHISIATNGLLIGQMDESLFSVMREDSCSLDVTLYPPLIKKISELERILIKNKINYSISKPVRYFSIALDSNKGHAEFAHRNHCGCPNLYKGMLYPCPIIAYTRYFNEHFGKNLNDCDGAIDIYDEMINGADIVKELRKVRELCDRCMFISKEHEMLQHWGQTDIASLNDYMVMGDKR